MYAIAGAILIHAAVVAPRGSAFLFLVGVVFILGDLASRLLSPLPGYVFFKPRTGQSLPSRETHPSIDHATEADTGV